MKNTDNGERRGGVFGDERLRLLFLSWEYPPRRIGGIASHVDDLTHALVDQGHEVTVLTVGDDEKAAGYEEDRGVKVLRVSPPMIEPRDFVSDVLHTNYRLIEKAGDLFADRPAFDLIHAHDWLVCWAGKTIKHMFKKPLVATIHATEYGRNNGLHNQLQYYINDVEWLLSFEAWRVICCSSYMAREVTNLFSLPSDKVAIVPNGVDTAKFRTVSDNDTRFRQKYAAPDEKIVYFIGRLVREKGIQVLIEAAPKILEHVPEAKFVISGSGPFSGHLKYKVNSLGLSHKFYFTGYVDNQTRNRLYRWAEVAVFPSLYEPFGIVVLEAMATETPVIASDVGGMSEIIEEGYDGFKVAPDNPGMLADRLIDVLRSPQKVQRVAENGLHKVNQEYSWPNIARRTVESYRRVLHEYQHEDWAKRHREQGIAPHRKEETQKVPVYTGMEESAERYGWAEKYEGDGR